MRVVLGVAGGIAAYKACSLLRLLSEAGHDVTVVPTAAALKFVGAPTWAALSGKPVSTDVWTDVHEVPHVRLGQEADLVVVAPATADLLAKAATGQADDLLTNVLLTARCPVVLAPAMHTEMWDHPATQANVSTLTERGVHVVPPASGRLTGKDTGPGRLPEPEDLYAVCERELARSASAARTSTAPASADPVARATTSADAAVRRGDLAGRRVVVTAGGTREPLDPVRFLGNRCSGKQGLALAAAGVARGADVTLVTSAPADLPGVDVVTIETALQAPRRRRRRDRRRRCGGHGGRRRRLPAVEPMRAPRSRSTTRPVPTARPTSPRRASRWCATPTSSPTSSGAVSGRPGRSSSGSPPRPATSPARCSTTAALLERKGCDVLVVNEVGEDKTFGADDNTVTILRRGSDEGIEVGPASKSVVADAVWDVVSSLL